MAGKRRKLVLPLWIAPVTTACIIIGNLIFVALQVSNYVNSTSKDIASSFGVVCSVNVFFSWLMISRLPWIQQYVWGRSYHRNFDCHYALAFAAVICLIIHSVIMLVEGETHFDGSINDVDTSGIILFSLCMALALWTLLTQFVHRVIGPVQLGLSLWVISVWVSRIMCFLIVIFGSMHSWVCLALWVSIFIMEVYAWWLDRLRVKANNAKFLGLHVQPGDVVTVEFQCEPDHFKYRAGQYVMVRIPELSNIDWHPFTISSSPFNDTQEINVRTILGDADGGAWSTGLLSLAKEWKKANKQRKPDDPEIIYSIQINGPFGGLQLPYNRGQNLLKHYPKVLIISGGSGVTFGQSVFNQCIHDLVGPSGDMWDRREIEFLWSTREDPLVVKALSRAQASLEQVKYGHFVPNLFDIGAIEQLRSANKHKIDIMLYLTQQSESYRAKLNATHSNRLDRLPSWMSIDDRRANLRGYVRQLCLTAIQQGVKRVAILVCGPEEMVRDVEAERSKHQSFGLSVDIHVERYRV